MLFGLHLLPVPLTFIRNSASVHHIVHQLREVPAKQHEGRIQPKHFPSPAADPCSDTSHNPNNFISSIALVEPAYGISKSIELERALELVLNVVACHELQGRNAKSSREQNELDRVGYVDPGRFGAFNVTDCGVDGLVLDGDSWNEVIGRFDDAAPGMLWLVSEVLLQDVSGSPLLTSSQCPAQNPEVAMSFSLLVLTLSAAFLLNLMVTSVSSVRARCLNWVSIVFHRLTCRRILTLMARRTPRTVLGRKTSRRLTAGGRGGRGSRLGNELDVGRQGRHRAEIGDFGYE